MINAMLRMKKLQRSRVEWRGLEKCSNMLHRVFWCEDIKVTLKTHVGDFNASEELRTCKGCHAVLPNPTKTPQWQGDSWT